MSQRRFETAFLTALSTACCLTMLCIMGIAASEGAPEPLVNCNEVMLEDRCACNERLLLALTQMKRIVPDPNGYASPGEADTAIVIQQHQQHRLRTYLAEVCSDALSPGRLPASEQHTGGWLHQRDMQKHLKPVGASNLCKDDCTGAHELEQARRLLVGRWHGWLTFFNMKPTALSFHVNSVGDPLPLDQPQNASFFTACSDQGSVFGRFTGGYVEFPWSDSFGSAYSIRLWRSPAPRSRDLEGVILLEVRPGEVVPAGLVSLSRAVKFDWTTPPSMYFCQDRDLEEQRKNVREAQEGRP